MTAANKTPKPAPLGRGLSALFGDADASYQPQAGLATIAAVANMPADGQTVRRLPIEWLQPGAYQPRRRFDETEIDALAESIRERGVLQPLLVRPIKGEKDAFEIVAGERRWRAAQKAGVHALPALVRDMHDREAMEIGLIENVQRQDLSPLEEAEGYRRLLDEFNHSQEALARIVGKSRPHITNTLRLLKLPEGVKAMLEDGRLSMAHARAIVTAGDPETLAKEIVKKNLSARQAEALAKRETGGRFAKKKERAATAAKGKSADLLAIEKSMSSVVGMKVRIHPLTNESGTLAIHYDTIDQFEELLSRLQAPQKKG